MAGSVRPVWASTSFDIFCRVIDNYGDIGVCWRLARQLAAAPWHNTVRLWVDRLDRFQHIEHRVVSNTPCQTIDTVEIVDWTEPPPERSPHYILIEGFGCTPPSSFLTRLRPQQTLWINLEYLSAEPWVATFHKKRSPNAFGVPKYFWFPGFTADTGGLLRRPGLLQERSAWQASISDKIELVRSLGLQDQAVHALQQGANLVFVFAYPQSPMLCLLECLAAGSRPSVVIKAGGDTQKNVLPSYEGKLHIATLPFVNQDSFDRLLWSSDLNVVRGEDSMVSALWAARPMIWQPYRQSDVIHLKKLEAWLSLSPWSETVKTVIRSWNTHDERTLRLAFLQAWAPAARRVWQKQSTQWCQQLATQTDLVSQLMHFILNHCKGG